MEKQAWSWLSNVGKVLSPLKYSPQVAREALHVGGGGAMGGLMGYYLNPTGGNESMIGGALLGAGLKTPWIRSLLGNSAVKFGDKYLRGSTLSNTSATRIDNRYRRMEKAVEELVTKVRQGTITSEDYQKAQRVVKSLPSLQDLTDPSLLANSKLLNSRILQLRNSIPTHAAYIDDVINAEKGAIKGLDKYLEKARILREPAGGMMLGGGAGLGLDTVFQNLHLYGKTHDPTKPYDPANKSDPNHPENPANNNYQNPFTYIGAALGGAARLSPGVIAALSSRLGGSAASLKTKANQARIFTHNSMPAREFGRGGTFAGTTPQGKAIFDSYSRAKPVDYFQGAGDYARASGWFSPVKYFGEQLGSIPSYARFALAGVPAIGMGVASHALGSGVPVAAQAIEKKLDAKVQEWNNQTMTNVNNFGLGLYHKALKRLGFRDPEDPNEANPEAFDFWKQQQLQNINQMHQNTMQRFGNIKDKTTAVVDGVQDFAHRNQAKYWYNPKYWFNPVPPRQKPGLGQGGAMGDIPDAPETANTPGLG